MYFSNCPRRISPNVSKGDWKGCAACWWAVAAGGRATCPTRVIIGGLARANPFTEQHGHFLWDIEYFSFSDFLWGYLGIWVYFLKGHYISRANTFLANIQLCQQPIFIAITLERPKSHQKHLIVCEKYQLSIISLFFMTIWYDTPDQYFLWFLYNDR